MKRTIIQCPECADRVSLEEPECSCGWVIEHRYNIPSFAESNRRFLVNTEVLATVMDHIQTESERAFKDRFGDAEFYEILATEMFDGLKEDWRLFFPELITGRCLDLYAGFGTRSLLLSEYAESVISVEPNIHAIRLLEYTDHHLRSGVTPVHANESCLHFESSSFDTIVVDAGRCPVAMSNLVSELTRLLSSNGTLIMKLQGLPGLIPLPGVSKWGLKSSLENSGGRTVQSYRRILEAYDFQHLEFLSLFPSKYKARYVFSLADSIATDWAINQLDARGGLLSRYTSKALTTFLHQLNKTGLLNQFYPDYLAVCTRVQDWTDLSYVPKASTDKGQVLIRGQRRGVILHLSKGGIDKIEKRPKHTRVQLTDVKERSNRTENAIIDRFHALDGRYGETIPDGHLEESLIGPIRYERPSSGTLLTERLQRDPEHYHHLLRRLFDWLLGVQTAYRESARQISTSEARDLVTCPEYDIRGADFSEPLELPMTPVNGDFSPDNIFLYPETDEVSTVIDWENGAVTGLPLIDSATCVITIGPTIFREFDEGINMTLMRENPYSSAVSAVVQEYCAELGIAPQAFIKFLPYPYIRNIRRARETDSTLQFSWGSVNPITRARFLTENVQKIIDTLL